MVERFAPENETSDAAMEGTCAAWLAEQVLVGNVDKCRDLVDTVCPENNWLIDFVMANHIQRYVDLIVSRGGHIQAERKVRLNEFIAGTLDAFATVSEINTNGAITRTLHVDDLKYGFEIVEPTSKQVLIYAAAIYLAMDQAGYPPTHISIGIYQPRGMHNEGPYRYRNLTPQQLINEANQVIEAGRKCFDPNAMVTPGRHCKYCEAAAFCGALTTELYDIYVMLSAKDNRNITNEELSSELMFLELVDDMLKGRKTGIKAVANARIDAGQSIPYYERRSGRGNRRWTVETHVVEAITGLDPTDGKMVSPAEMERRGVDPSMLDHLTEQPKTKARLERVTPRDMARRFGVKI